MNIMREQIYLAALLHDIGKFFQRADARGATTSNLLSNEIKRLEGLICPRSIEGFYSHKHVLWTAQFFQNEMAQLRRVLQLNESQADSLLRLAAAHHRPEQFWEKVIQKADHYASGADRSTADEAWRDAREEDDRNWDAFRRVTMRSIFEGISLPGSTPQQYRNKLPLLSLQFAKKYFPSETVPHPDYEGLWGQFVQQFRTLNTQSFHAFADSLLFLLEKFASRVPASTMHLPDVSLYDHLKITAALALCLYDYLTDRGQTDRLPEAQECPFALVGGDLSGIQKFIYAIAMKNAAKNLKGRSFYLQLLLDTVVRYVLSHPDLLLFDACLVYSSGGGFYVIAPNKRNLPHVLQQIEHEISRNLFSQHQSELFLALDYVSFGEDLLLNRRPDKDIGQIWHDLSQKLQRRKHQSHRVILTESPRLLFEPSEVGGETEIDAFDGRELPDPAQRVQFDEDSYISRYNNQIVQTGKKLKSVQYWVQAPYAIEAWSRQELKPINLPIYNYFLNVDDIDHASEGSRFSVDDARILGFNDLEQLQPPFSGNRNIHGFTFYGGNDYPVNNFNNPKTFEELAGVTFADPGQKVRSESPYLTRLGVLRMDVDNLGQIFREGFAPAKRSFSRYCTLSRSLDYFFKGYLNTIWENNNEYRQLTQIIYSGGDDVFVVGRWDVLIRMTHDIYKAFREWTCHSTAFTLSGGMAILPPKYPLLKAALLAQQLEEAAKSHQFDSQQKNAFAFFYYTEYNGDQLETIPFALNWEHEFTHVQDLKKKILEMLQAEDLPASFVNNLFTLMQMAAFQYNREKDIYIPRRKEFIWITAYQFQRAVERTPNEAVKDFLHSCVKHIATGRIEGHLQRSRYHALQLLTIAARWAAYELRTS